MSTQTSLTGWVRWVAVGAVVGGVAGGVGMVGAAGAQAAVLPQPVASLTSAVTSQPAPLPIASLLGSGPALTTPLSPPAVPGLAPAPGGAPGPASAPAPLGAPAPSSRPAGASSTPSGTTSNRSSSTATASSRSSTAAPARVAVSTPAASLCLIPTGSMSPAVEVNLTAVGHDLSSPLVKQFPQVFAPCPANAVPAGSDTVAAVDASLTTLVGACVRVTRQVVPVQTTIVVLDHDLIQQLESAGVPLQQLLVPCPAGAAGGGGGGTTGGSGVATGAQQAGDVAAALTAAPLGGRLAFTGATVVPLALLAVVLLWAGSLLVRFSRSLTVAPRRPRG